MVAVPTQVFYDHPDAGRHLIRFAFCKRDEVIDEAATPAARRSRAERDRTQARRRRPGRRIRPGWPPAPRRRSARRPLRGLLLGGRLDHHPDQRLGAGRAQQHPAGLAQLGLGQRHRGLHRRRRGAGRAVADRHVDQHLRQLGAPPRPGRPATCRSAAIRAIRCRPVSTPSPVVAYAGITMCPLCSPPSARPPAAQLLQHVPVADLGLDQPDARLASWPAAGPRLLITVATSVSSVSVPASRIASARIAMIWSPSTTSPAAVDREAAVGVAVVGDAQVGAVLERRPPRTASRWVEPQSSLMLRPSGSAWIAMTSAPASPVRRRRRRRRPRRWRSRPRP